MPPLKLIFPDRSDGTNERPPQSKLQKTTDKNGTQRWLEEVPRDEAKHRDWRKKLGGMTITQYEQIGTDEERKRYKAESQEGMIYMLHDFPDGYTLYEQHTIKTAGKEGGQAEERRDAYLYGHPGGEKKRFRTPKEFFEHFWWLATDEAGDPNNCTCPRCVPEDLNKEVDDFIAGKPSQPQNASSKSKSAKADKTSAPASAAAVRPTPTLTASTIKQSSSARASPVATPAAASVQSAPKPSQQRPASSGRSAPKSHLQPSQPSKPLSQEQADDAELGSFIYRIGEIVWFSKGAAWGLGILVSRERTITGSLQQFTYHVQPLSYPHANNEVAVIHQEQHLKPWYAYSPPNPTHERLNQSDVINLDFNKIPWQQVLSGSLGAGETEVDASIYAAKTVDRSYCPFQRIGPAGDRAAWNGIFIGAEKVWRGDAIRLRPVPTANPALPNPEILIVTDIIEASPPSGPPAPDRLAPRDAVLLIGDRYAYAQLPIKIPDDETHPLQYLTARIPTRIPTLPLRVAEDLMAQNRYSVPRLAMASSWRLVATKQTVTLAEVKGRWYESLRMLPIINPELFQHAIGTGQIPDVGRSLNQRGDSPQLRDGSPGYRFSHREVVLGYSVPQSFTLPKIEAFNEGGNAGV